MKYRRLGASGPAVSEVGLGTWSMGGDEWGSSDDQVSLDVLRAAVHAGVTIIDTADVYGAGHSEELLAEAVPADSDVVVVTKGGWDIYTDPPVVGGARRRYDPPYLEHAVSSSLKRLNRRHLDVYLLHNPTREDLQRDRPFQTLARLRQAGLVRWVGASVGSEADARAALEADIHVLEVPFNLVRRWAVGVLAEAQARGVAILAREPLERGLLTGKYLLNPVFPDGDHRTGKGSEWIEAAREPAKRIAAVAERAGCPAAQIAIAYPLSYPAVTSAVVGARTLDQLAANLEAVQVQLGEAQRGWLESGGPPA
jgi:aryl-alcohol dehydrogenase-like predicted oxidoreductase